jgi:hypothetical protein
MTSSTALSEFRARTAEIRDELTLVSLATRLRPRLGGLLNREAKGADLSLALEFVAHKSDRAEGILGALLVRLMAAFERFLRRRIAECVVAHQARAATYDDVPEQLRRKHFVLSGRALGMIDTAPDHLVIDPNLLIEALASCKIGSTNFSLSSRAFEIAVNGASPDSVRKALESIGVMNWLDRVGADASVSLAVGARPNKLRETTKLVEERLFDLSRWRNNLAHAGDVEVSVNEDLLERQLTFLAALAAAIDTACK